MNEIDEIIKRLEARISYDHNIQLSSQEIRALLEYLYQTRQIICVNDKTPQNGDVMVLKNGERVIYDENRKWLLNKYYDDDLKCYADDSLSVSSIERTTKYTIFQRTKVK